MLKVANIKKSIIQAVSFILSNLYCTYLRIRFSNLKLLKKINIYGGIPYIYASTGSNIQIGQNCNVINDTKYNRIGIIKKSSICAERNGKIVIGDNVGMSGVSICSHDQIVIGNNVLIGANVFIFDTDFHSLISEIRLQEIESGNPIGEKTEPVYIGNNVFIGANAIITKGVKIGDNSIIATGSIVTKNIPENEIWGGNPAKFIRALEFSA